MPRATAPIGTSLAVAAAIASPGAAAGRGAPAAADHAAATAVVVAAAPGVRAGTPGDAPRVEVAVPTVDLGDVHDDELAEAVFVVRNAGGRDLHVERVEPT